MAVTGRPPPSHRRYVLCLAGLYVVIAAALGVSPYDWRAWVLEHFMVVAGLVLLVSTYRSFPLSRVSYSMIFVFLCFHEIGAHFTYSLVPYDDWFNSLVGTPLNSVLGLERNHYDRAIHFLYGLTLAWPYREAFLHAVRGQPALFWSYLLPLTFTVATSVLYEFAEWAAAIVFGGDLGMAFLGTQGDEWDAHKDIFCAVVGGLVTTMMMIGIHLTTRRDFPAEWAESHTRGERPVGI